MSIVGIRTVEFDDTTELFHDRSTCSFDTEHVEDFDTAVGISACKVHAGDVHYCLEFDTVRLKHPILFGLDATLVVGIHYIVFQKEHPVNARYAAQTDPADAGKHLPRYAISYGVTTRLSTLRLARIS